MKLKTESVENGRRALAAFFKLKKLNFAERFHYDWTFEHGQLWITRIDGAAWSVCDAVGGPSVDGFDFEQVSEGED